MAKSFGIVEDKLREAEFFLTKLRESNRFEYESRYYFSAFISAARSVTMVLQKTMKDVDGFTSWYQNVQSQLKADPLAKYFVEIRNGAIHEGFNPLNQVTVEHLREDLIRQMHQNDHSHILILPNFQAQGLSTLTDAVETSKQYFISLIKTVFECYKEFRYVVDPQWYFTYENFTDMGKTIEDAIAEFGLPPEWALCAPEGESAWRILRSQQPSCQINDLFQEYIDGEIKSPDNI